MRKSAPLTPRLPNRKPRPYRDGVFPQAQRTFAPAKERCSENKILPSPPRCVPRAVRMKRAVRGSAGHPAIVYGAFQDPVRSRSARARFSRSSRSNTGYNTIFTLAIQGGENTPVMVVDHPGRSRQEHRCCTPISSASISPSASASASRLHRRRAAASSAGRIARNHHPRH